MDRKEAIEVVKKNYPHVAASGSEFETALRVLAPELAESEDERKRDAIKCIIRAYGKTQGGYCGGFDMDTLVAYLDKQKEQKPAEWDDDNDKIRRNLMSLLYCMRGDRITEETYKKYYPWLRDLPKKFNLQSPAEWSEEDEKIFNELIMGYKTYNPEFEVNGIKMGEIHQWLVNRFKLLRPQPHWKPSEEQMATLKKVVFSRPIGEDGINILEGLYEQLKEL